MERYSLKIEHLLCQISPTAKGMRAIIAQNPYKEILNVLDGRVSIKSLEKFKMYYQGIDGRNIASLQKENYNFEILISDLTKIINNIKGEN
jgi:hypothetical protein